MTSRHYKVKRHAVTVAVADDGIGIDDADIEQLFEPFKRTRSAGISGLEGSGLGLAICQEIARAHGGRRCATSDGPGHGSTYALVLQIAPPG